MLIMGHAGFDTSDNIALQIYEGNHFCKSRVWKHQREALFLILLFSADKLNYDGMK